MVKSMGLAARSVTSTVIIAVGLMYLYAVIFTSWAKDNHVKSLLSKTHMDCPEYIAAREKYDVSNVTYPFHLNAADTLACE